MRIMVRLKFGVTEPHQAAAIPARDVKARTRALMCLSKGLCVGEGYFFFFLPVFFFAFLAFLAFLAMLPSTIPKLVQCKSTSTRTNVKYTTIAKLILRVLNKVNSGHAVARLLAGDLSHNASTRYLDTTCCLVGTHPRRD